MNEHFGITFRKVFCDFEAKSQIKLSAAINWRSDICNYNSVNQVGNFVDPWAFIAAYIGDAESVLCDSKPSASATTKINHRFGQAVSLKKDAKNSMC